MTRRRWGRWGRQALRAIWVFFAVSVVMPVIAATSLLSAVLWRVPRALGRWGRQRGSQAIRVMLWVFAVVAVTGLLSAVGWAFWRVPQALYTYVPDPKDRATVEASTRNGMLATLAGVAALGSLVLTSRTYRLSQQGQLADRYTRAIAQLGDDKLDVRLGGIYALERIAVDSKRDHPTVVEVLGAYVRERRGSTPMVRPANRRTAHPLTIRKQVKLGVDIQAALTVLGRLPRRSGVSRGDLSEVNLTGAYLGRADLTRADLFGTKLTEVTLFRAKLAEATLDTADLTGATLRRANLRKATFYKADLTGASLRGADLRKAFLEVANLTRVDLSFGKLTRAYLRKAGLVEADLYGANCTLANLSGANFTKADLSAAIFTLANLSGANLAEARELFQYQVNVAFGDKYTQLPPGLRHPAWWRWVSSVRNRLELDVPR